MCTYNDENSIFGTQGFNSCDDDQEPEKTALSCEIEEEKPNVEPDEPDEGPEVHPDESVMSFLEHLRAFASLHSTSDEDDDDDDDDYDDDDDDDDDKKPAGSSAKKAPVGKRVILRSDYKSNDAYCDAVVKSMKAVLRKNHIKETPHDLAPGVKLFVFDKTTHGVDVDCRILCEYERNNYRIEFKFNVKNRPGRVPLIDHFCQSKNFPLRYGSIIMDHDDGEKKIEYSSCFLGSFSEEAFEHYWDLLNHTLLVYAQEFAGVAEDKKLSSENRQLVRQLINELAENLPSRIKPENEALFNGMAQALGDHLSQTQKKLLNYLIVHSK